MRLEYSAELYLINCTINPETVGFLLGQWLNAHHPGHDGKTVSFEAEIVDHNHVDIHFKISGITDRYLMDAQKDGIHLYFAEPQAADPIINPQGIHHITTNQDYELSTK